MHGANLRQFLGRRLSCQEDVAVEVSGRAAWLDLATVEPNGNKAVAEDARQHVAQPHNGRPCRLDHLVEGDLAHRWLGCLGHYFEAMPSCTNDVRRVDRVAGISWWLRALRRGAER